MAYLGVIVEIPARALPADAVITIDKAEDWVLEDYVPKGLALKLCSDIYEITTVGRDISDLTASSPSSCLMIRLRSPRAKTRLSITMIRHRANG